MTQLSSHKIHKNGISVSRVRGLFGKNDQALTHLLCCRAPQTINVLSLFIATPLTCIHTSMKSTSTILVVMAAFGAAGAREAILGNDSSDQRRLGGFKWNLPDDYYTKLYERCCEPAAEEESWDGTGCNCPKRLSTDTPPSWAQAWLGSKSYLEKWEDQCSPGGWLCNKALGEGEITNCVDLTGTE
jgi:hypothetical protein